MALYSKLEKAIESNATSRTKVTSTRSLLAIMKAVDFNVFRYRQKTWVTLQGPRGGSQDQRQLTDCQIIDMDNGFKLYVFNINQFFKKVSGEFSTELIWPNGIKQLNNLRSKKNFEVKDIPSEIIWDLGVKDLNYVNTWELSKGVVANKEWYAAFILESGSLVPLRKTKYAEIQIKGSTSKKMIYREKRDGNLDESFIKVLGAYILATVVDKNGTPLIEMDIDPKNYVPKKENSDTDENVESNSIDLDDTLEFTLDSNFDSEVKMEEVEWGLKKLIIPGTYNSDDLDSAKEYCAENGLRFDYNGVTGEMIFIWLEEKLEEVKWLFLISQVA